MSTVKLGFGLRLRLGLSLLVRALLALCILASLTLVVAVVVSVFGALLGLALAGWLVRGYEAVLAAPRLSTVAPAHAGVVAVLAAAALVAVVYGWEAVSNWTDTEYLLPPHDPVSLAGTVVVLGSLYLLIIEGIVALGALLSAVLSATDRLVVVLGFGVVLGVVGMVAEVRLELRHLRERLLENSVPAAETHPGVAATAQRLAQSADVPQPAVRVSDSARPESFAVGRGSDAVVVVSAGLLETLSEPETEAVLAHEVSHLANGDGRVMEAALAPVLAADKLLDEDPSDAGDRFLNWWFRGLKRYGQLGGAVLSRGRERSADAGAAVLTGDPAALASALERLQDHRRRPRIDLREWEASVAALDILPPADRERATGPFRTHPPTDERLAWLRRLAARAERG